MSNRITIENSITTGVTDKSYWDASSSDQIEGFTTDISVNAGSTIDFKINVNGNDAQLLPYKIEIFRLGYYGGHGAREVAEIINPDGTVQPAALFDANLGLVDAGNWSVSDSWAIPADAVSGVYLARIQRLDSNGLPIEGATNQIPFIVRNDGIPADIVLQTSDTTWQAYNGWGGNNSQIGPNFYGDPSGTVVHDPVPDPGLGAQDRAYAVSYNRPFLTRDGGGAAAGAQDYLFGADFAAISWLEQNGYDVSYIAGVDTERLGADYLSNYQAFISVGHDEYWSGGQRENVEAARDAGVNLLFWSGNEVYWKTRWDASISADHTDYRTLVSYKETWANGDPNAAVGDYANIDPSTEWTGTWRDMRFVGNPEATGQAPENSLTGQLFGPDGTGEFGGAIDVPQQYASLRYWDNTSVATNGGASDLAAGIIGYEWDVVANDANRPEGLITLSSTTLDWSAILVDQGNRVAPGTATHNLSLYRAESGALVFGAGTVFWSWGLSNEHDNAPYGADAENLALQQFTVNLFADMGIQPGSLDSSLVAGVKSTDVAPATISIDNVPDEVAALSSVMITGTATDDDGNPVTSDGVVAAVELSFDGGATWKLATGTTSWSYLWRPATEGSQTIQARAIDDSLNVFNATVDSEAVVVTSAVPPNSFSLFDPAVAVTAPLFSEGAAVEVGMRFTVDRVGDVTQLRYYRASGDSSDTDVRDGHLWNAATGELLATVTFNSAPGESGWQIASLATPFTLQAGVEYIVSYRTAEYTATNGFFAPANEVTFDGVDDDAFSDPFGVISAPEDAAHHNGMYSTGPLTMPDQSYQSSNYWVDVTFSPADAGPNTPPVITSGNSTAPENQAAAGTVTATDSDGDTVQYSISGGADGGLFNINTISGALTFKTLPNFEVPADANGDNVYDVIVGASDTHDTVTKAITVTVTDVVESGGTPTGSTIFADVPTNFSNDPNSYELGTKFLSSQDGSIVALRYYRGTSDAADTDVRTLKLWTIGGTELGSVVVTSDPGQTGWQVGTLTTPISISADQVYVVSYGYVYGADDVYAATQGYFNSSHSGADGILTAPASGGSVGGNGVFAASTPGSFPTGSFNASNYWVDVIFQAAGTGGDNDAPVFTSAATLNALENQTNVGQVTATDGDLDPLVYSIVGGADAGLFTIQATTGRIEFKNPQDFESGAAPFELTVGVNDGTVTTTQNLTINLTDVDETADGPAAMTGALLQAQYIFGPTPTTVFSGAGSTQTATVGAGVEFQNLPSAGPDVGNGDNGLATVDAGAQTVRISFPLDPTVFSGRSFVNFAGETEGKPYNGVLLSDVGSLAAIRSVRIVGQEGFTTSSGELQALTQSDLTVTEDGIFLNVAGKGRLVDIDPDTPGAQAPWVELLVELNDAPVLSAPLADQQAVEGTQFSYTVPASAFSDYEGDTLTYSATLVGGGALPAWLIFDPATRTFSGTPGNGDVGSVNVLVNAFDGYDTTSDALVISVADSAATQGTSGNDTFVGTAGGDLFLLQQGGDDNVSGGPGNDGFYFGAALSAGDVVDGGAGNDDQVALQADYSGLVINAANFAGVETFALLGGADTRFGAPGTSLYHYDLITSGSFGRNIIVNANGLSSSESFTFNGSAEVTGSFTFYGGFGAETLTGGQGSDGFYFGPGRFNPLDSVNGGSGPDDQLGLRGDYTIDFNSAGYASALANIDTIALLSDLDPHFAQIGDGEFDYHLVLADSMLADGRTMTISGGGLGATETMDVDGSLESSAALRLIAGAADDVLRGGGGADIIFGGRGADSLSGGGGADQFIYTNALDSTPTSSDQILDFTHGIDTLSLSGIDANSLVAENQAFTFIGDAAFSGAGASSAGELRAVQTGSVWQVTGDVNGDGVADFGVFLTMTSGQSLSSSDMLI